MKVYFVKVYNITDLGRVVLYYAYPSIFNKTTNAIYCILIV